MISVVSLYFSRGNKCDESVKVTTLIFLFFEIFLTAFNLKTGLESGLIIKIGILINFEMQIIFKYEHEKLIVLMKVY